MSRDTCAVLLSKGSRNVQFKAFFFLSFHHLSFPTNPRSLQAYLLNAPTVNTVRFGTFWMVMPSQLHFFRDH